MIASLSIQAFTTKPTVPTFNSRTFRVNVELNAEKLCHELTNGHILVPKILDTTEKNGKIDRTVHNIEGRQYVMVDIESDDYSKIPEITPELFIQHPSELSPTFVYASYSDGVKGHRYHFVWVFKQLITDKETNLDLWNRCRTIAKEIVGENFEDDGSVKDMARLCFGSYNKPWFSPNGFRTFDISEFDSVVPISVPNTKPQKKRTEATGVKRSASGAVSGDIYDRGNHFGYERRQDVIFTLFHYWKDPDKVRQLYEQADPHRTNPEEGESLIQSAVTYHQQGQLYPTATGISLCRRLDLLPQRNDFTKPLVCDVELKVGKYISECFSEIMSNLGKISLILSEPGSGKTHFSQRLEGNVLVVQMLKSIVDSAKYPDEWAKVYDTYRFPKFWEENEETRILCTVDKLAQLDVEKLKRFDYIVVDESHIIFDSSEYRRISFVIPLFSDLCNSDWTGKVILMTGTPILEQKHFSDLHIINVTTRNSLVRKCAFHVGKKPEQRAARFIAECLKAGKKVLFPTNRSKARSRILAMVRHNNPDLTVNAQVFSRPLHEEEGNVKIRMESVVSPDTNVLCCTTYLGVGLDIFDENDWEVVMLSEWTGAQIIQFANRLRAKDLFINCFYSDKSRRYSYRAQQKEKMIFSELKELNNIRSDGGVDPVLHSKLIKDRIWAKWDDDLQRYVFDEVHGNVYLDWIDYKDYHSTLAQVKADLEAVGYDVETISSDKAKSELPKAKRHSSLNGQDNEILAESLINLMSWTPDFRNHGDLKLIDKRILSQYATNIRPNILKLLKLFDPDNDLFEMPTTGAWENVKGILQTFITTENGKRRFSEYGFRNFSDCHVMVSRLGSGHYSEMFQNFYKSVSDFVKSKEKFTQAEINDFINARTELYLIDSADTGSRKKVEKALKEYFKVFVDKKTGKRITVRYKTTKCFRLSLRYTLSSESAK